MKTRNIAGEKMKRRFVDRNAFQRIIEMESFFLANESEIKEEGAEKKQKYRTVL